MTQLDHNTCATDLNDLAANTDLSNRGHTIRHIETWTIDGNTESFIVWDNPAIAEHELPY